MADAYVDCGRTDTVFFTSGCSGCKPVSQWPPLNLAGGMDSVELVRRIRSGEPLDGDPEPTTTEKLEALSGSKFYDIRFEQYLPGHWEVVVGEVEDVPYQGERFNRVCSGMGATPEEAIDAAYREMVNE